MKNILIFLALIFSFAAAAKADDGRSPNRLGNQIYVTFDKPRNVDLKEGVRYSPNCPDPDVKLDLYYPNAKAGFKKPVPCILLIHGGGWAMANEKKFAMMAAEYASRGYVVASITYRLVPKYSMEDCASDVWMSLKWLKEHAAEFGGNPELIGAMGGSAGGHLTALLATAHNSRICKKIFSDGTSPKIQAAVPMAPPTDISKRKSRFSQTKDWEILGKELSPINWVSKESAPMRILHAQSDPVVPLRESTNIKAAYDKAGAKCEIIAYPSKEHAFWNASHKGQYRFRSWEDGIAFFDQVLKNGAIN